MTPAEFKTKWAKVNVKESAAYQSHFDDVCRLLGLKTPLEADPQGESFCFQKRVVKDAELFELHEGTATTEPSERGFADVWKRGCFAWEYKGRKKNLDEAYRQLLRYRESLLNPPLLVVCDFDRFIIRTNFNGTVQETHEFTNAQIDRPEILRTLRCLFLDPEFLRPQRTTAQVTQSLAEQIAEVAKSLQNREAVELPDARTRAEMNFAQRKNLRIARFLNRIVFCFFAEDTGLLPKNLFAELLKTGLDDLHHFAETLERLFKVMAKGGTFGKDKIRHFNGHLFEDSTVFELTEDELRRLADAGEADWQFIQPGIMGTLFERALDFEEGGKLRAQLGAHYTSEADIKTLVEPVLMAPFRREWAALKRELAAAYAKGEGTPKQRDKLATFQRRLGGVTVLDPACGSGNFLYVSLQLLLDLEKEVVTFATQLGFKLAPLVSVQQLRAIEINPYAFELAQVSVQIGYLQWRRDNGFDNDRSPVLQNLDGFQNEDALLVPHFRSKAKTLKESQAGEHGVSDALKFYTEREWPASDVIVSNPPFLGDKLMRGELGDGYVDELRQIYGNRIPGQSDFCCYWFEKARNLIEVGKCRRAGLLATQGIRGGANREVLKRVKNTGDIFFAESDRPWILDGANVHVSMVGFDDGSERNRVLDARSVPTIHPNLTCASDTTKAIRLAGWEGVAFIGTTKKAPLDIPQTQAIAMLLSPNPHGKPNSEVLFPYLNADAVVKREPRTWIIDFPVSLSLVEAACYANPFAYVKEHVWPARRNHRESFQRHFWWRPARPCPVMKEAIARLPRFLATPTVSKHRVFVWLEVPYNADHQLYVFARADDYFFGVLQSRFHEVWALKQGTRLETRPRYTPTTCFETFPLPRPTPAQETAIADAAKELNDLRERWLNPPEWTETRTLEFPGTVGGPWDRYIDKSKIANPKSQIGLVRYPRLEPRDADCAAKLKKRTLTNLYNERPAWLDLAHKKLDAAVAAAYGWPADLTDEQILERLLTLNLERAAEEAKTAKAVKPRVSRPKRDDELI
jgi:hypothetical protein